MGWQLRHGQMPKEAIQQEEGRYFYRHEQTNLVRCKHHQVEGGQKEYKSNRQDYASALPRHAVRWP